MAESPHGSVSCPPLSLDPDLDDFLQNFPPSDFQENHSLQQPSTESPGRLTAEINQSFAEDPQGLPLSGSEVAHMSQSLPAAAQSQHSFIRLTSFLKNNYLEMPTPSPSERLRLAACTGLDQSDVSAWFDIIRSLIIDVGANSIPMPTITQASVSELFSNLNPPQNSARPIRPLRTTATSRERRSSTGYSDPSKRRQIEDVSQDKGSLRALENQQEVSQRQPSTPSKKGEYCCPTTACKFRAKNFDQWHTHQSRTHFPSEIFVCGIKSSTKPCNKGPDDPCKRKDNFVTHLKDSHGFEPGHALDQEVSKRTVKVTGLFHDTCGFCSKILATREASIEHIGDHIKSGDKITDWTHRCTSLEHTLQHHVHFEISLDRPEMDNHSSENFDGLIQRSDYDHGDGGNPFDREPNSDTREDCAPTHACASTSGGSAGDSPYACTVPSGRSARYTRDSSYACASTSGGSAGDSPYACTVPSGRSARYTRDSSYACTITTGRYTRHSLARSIEAPGPLPSFTKVPLDDMSRKSISNHLRRSERQPNSSSLGDWTKGTRLPDRYEQRSSRPGSSRANSSLRVTGQLAALKL